MSYAVSVREASLFVKVGATLVQVGLNINIRNHASVKVVSPVVRIKGKLCTSVNMRERESPFSSRAGRTDKVTNIEVTGNEN